MYTWREANFYAFVTLLMPNLLEPIYSWICPPVAQQIHVTAIRCTLSTPDRLHGSSCTIQKDLPNSIVASITNSWVCLILRSVQCSHVIKRDIAPTSNQDLVQSAALHEDVPCFLPLMSLQVTKKPLVSPFPHSQPPHLEALAGQRPMPLPPWNGYQHPLTARSAKVSRQVLWLPFLLRKLPHILCSISRW